MLNKEVAIMFVTKSLPFTIIDTDELGFCVHGITDDWKLVKGLLRCIRIFGSHTGKAVLDKFIDVTTNFGIDSKIVKVIYKIRVFIINNKK